MSDGMEDLQFDQELIDDFVTESLEGMAEIETDLLQIEADGADVDTDLVNRVFRSIHSIKGAAGFLMLERIEKLSHSLENVLDRIRGASLVPTTGGIEVMLEAADTLRRMLENVGDSNSVEVGSLVEQLRLIEAGEIREKSCKSEPAVKRGPADAVAERNDPAEASTAAEPVASNSESEPASNSVSNDDAASQADTESGKQAAATDSQPKASSGASGDANVRVGVSVLDRLMNLAGELVLGRNQLLQTIASGDTRMLEMVATRLDQVTSELQGTIMQTRMQPVGNVFNKFTRVVRDLSRTLGKQCQLVIDGKDVELDKTIIEAIGDPLTHLIRNSVDHGVESPQVRQQNGKPAEGTVHLKAFHQDGKVNISISDDGAGIDAGRLKTKAVEKGLITQERADVMCDAEALRLIFMPGFSTAEQVSAVSGRGVGMDVVKTNFERLGGSIDIDTVLGKGTTMTIRLPLTLAIIPSLVVHSGDRRFALPQVNISELVRIRTGEESRRIEKLRGVEVLRLRDSLLPLIRLSSYLGSDSAANPDSSRSVDAADQPESSRNSKSAINIVVLEAGSLRYGLVVDGLSDSEEIVVKPLGRHMQDVKSLAGATVLGDGEIALILDVTGLAGQMGLEITETTETRNAEQETAKRDDAFSTLLFTNHPREQFGVPMSCVSRIERVREEQFDSVAGQEVLQYRDRTLPLLSIENCITALPREQKATLHVIVFQAGNREVGLIAPKILDIRDVPGELDTETFAEAGVLGSIVLEGQTTRIFDPYELVREQRPSWFAKNRPAASSPRPQAEHVDDGLPKILLAEDSAFFQQKVKQFLEQLGTTVVTADDGEEAWETLNSGQHEFSLVVTDIEMPRLNGFELCERIRASEQFESMPVLALTSLAGDADRERGRRAGIDEYLVKLDRDRLVMAATSHLHRVVAAPRRDEAVPVT
jgi:two-component system chemotaxis sensor kinase CheA